MVIIKMYIVNHSEKSGEKVRQLNEALESVLGNDYDLEVFNVIEHPESAQEHGVFATPTVIRISPGPIRRIIGDLSNRGCVLLGLGLTECDNASC